MALLAFVPEVFCLASQISLPRHPAGPHQPLLRLQSWGRSWRMEGHSSCRVVPSSAGLSPSPGNCPSSPPFRSKGSGGCPWPSAAVSGSRTLCFPLWLPTPLEVALYEALLHITQIEAPLASCLDPHGDRARNTFSQASVVHHCHWMTLKSPDVSGCHFCFS